MGGTKSNIAAPRHTFLQPQTMMPMMPMWHNSLIGQHWPPTWAATPHSCTSQFMGNAPKGITEGYHISKLQGDNAYLDQLCNMETLSAPEKRRFSADLVCRIHDEVARLKAANALSRSRPCCSFFEHGGAQGHLLHQPALSCGPAHRPLRKCWWWGDQF